MNNIGILDIGCLAYATSEVLPVTLSLTSLVMSYKPLPWELGCIVANYCNWELTVWIIRINSVFFFSAGKKLKLVSAIF